MAGAGTWLDGAVKSTVVGGAAATGMGRKGEWEAGDFYTCTTGMLADISGLGFLFKTAHAANNGTTTNDSRHDRHQVHPHPYPRYHPHDPPNETLASWPILTDG